MAEAKHSFAELPEYLLQPTEAYVGGAVDLYSNNSGSRRPSGLRKTMS